MKYNIWNQVHYVYLSQQYFFLQFIKTYNYDLENIEQIFYLTNAAAYSGCVNNLSPEVISAATKVLDKKEPMIQELYYAVYSLKAVGKGTTMDKDEALKNLVQLLKKDDSPAKYVHTEYVDSCLKF